MKYYYDVIFYLSDEIKRNEIILTDWEDIFKEAREHYNKISKNARNTKSIINLEINEKEIKIRLESDSYLEKPTLALRSFSQYLVQTNFGEIAANNNALFRGSFEEVITNKQGMSPSEMIKTLAEILMANKTCDSDLILNLKTMLINWRDNQ